ncbi:TetR/AcrR family transcriptional regulator [Gordonia iterans]
MTEIASKSERTRRRLLAAAVDLFARQGFHGTTTRDLARAAGMSPAAVYVHYPSKEDLLYKLSLAGHRDTLAVLEAGDDPDLPPAPRLKQLIRVYTHHHATRPHLSRVLNYELAALAPEHSAEIRALRDQISQRIAQVVSTGVTTGAFGTVDGPAVTMAILSLNVDIARWFPHRPEVDPDRLADFYADLALTMVEARDHGRAVPE